MIAPAIFQGIILSSVAVAANQGKCAQTFANVTQKCATTLMEMRREEDEPINESFWTLMSRFWAFSIFCSHITWIIVFFLLTKNFWLDVFSSDNTLYIDIFQCNLYLTSYGYELTNQSYFVLLHKFLHRLENFPSNMT